MITDPTPFYTEERRTKSPLFIGATRDTPTPGEGLTSPTSLDSLNLSDKRLLTQQALRSHLGAAAIKMIWSGTPKNRGVMFATPTPGDPADTVDTIRHETIHSVIRNSGVTDEDLIGLEKDHPTIVRPVLDAFNRSNHLAGSNNDNPHPELPAYLGRHDPAMMEQLTETQRADYLGLVHKLLARRDPSGKSLRAFQSLTEPSIQSKRDLPLPPPTIHEHIQNLWNRLRPNASE